MATTFAPAIDWASEIDLLGSKLVADIEAYLKSQPLPPAPSRPRLTVPHVPRYGSVVQPWDHKVHKPERTWADRILRRRPTPEVTVRQFLELLDSYIHQHGWTQGLLWDPQGRVCLLGARARVLAAGYGTPAVDEQARLLIGNQLGYRGEGIPLDNWNDMPERRVCDIHALLQEIGRAHV